MKTKLSKEEKALIKAYVNLKNSQTGVTLEDSNNLEYTCSQLINDMHSEHRQLVESFIISLIEKF